MDYLVPALTLLGSIVTSGIVTKLLENRAKLSDNEHSERKQMVEAHQKVLETLQSILDGEREDHEECLKRVQRFERLMDSRFQTQDRKLEDGLRRLSERPPIDGPGDDR